MLSNILTLGWSCELLRFYLGRGISESVGCHGIHGLRGCAYCGVFLRSCAGTPADEIASWLGLSINMYCNRLH